MSKTIKGNNKHLTLDERVLIEKSLDQCEGFRKAAIETGKTPSTISREVKRNRIPKEHNPFNEHPNKCSLSKTCQKRNVCDPGSKTCRRKCSSCGRCNTKCPDFVPISYHCEKTDVAPYVCNGCDQKTGCRKDKMYYRASAAQRKYDTNLKESRQGINVTEAELAELDSVVSPLIEQGQSPYMILQNHPEISQCEKTIYNYIDSGALSVKNLDLRKKVVYKPRKKRKAEVRDTGIFEGRTYQDFCRFMEENPGTKLAQMDTVEGRKGSRKVLLTLHFLNCSFMPAFLLETKEARRVRSIFDQMEKAVGTILLNKTMPVILTDRGTEFSDPAALEHGDMNLVRTSIYFCDPMASWQKGNCEKNHEELRKICPKGTSFDNLTQQDINLVMSHVNSTPREHLGGVTPFALAKMMLPEQLLDFFGLTEIAPDSVILSPDLLKGKIDIRKDA